MNEIWKDIPDYEGCYQVSDLGRVRSLDRVIQTRRGSRSLRGRVLRPASSKSRYLTVTLSMDGNCKTVYVHQIVMHTFIGPVPETMEACHGDGDLNNNYLTNLRYDTHINNQLDRRKHGTNQPGEFNANAKLTNKQVMQIVERYHSGETQTVVAKSLRVSRSLVSNIITGRNWSEITGIQYDTGIRYNRKLTFDQASNILDRHKQGERQIDLAREFSISKSIVYRLVRGITWKELHQ